MESYKASRNEQKIEKEESQTEKNEKSTEDALNAGLEVVEHIPVARLYAKAAKGINKVTGGALTKGAAKVVNKGLENSPMGNQMQGVINSASDSGLTNAVGQAASIKNGNPSNNMKDNTESNSQNNKKDNLLGGLFGTGSNKSSSIFNLGSFNLSNSNIKVKIIIIAACTFLFLILMVATVLASDDLYNLSLTNNSTMSVSKGTFSGTVDSTLYEGSGAVMPASGQTLSSLLGQEKIDQINIQIKSDVESSGRGTGGAVATAAYDFIKLLLDNGINMTYTFGGEHGLVKEGIDSSWGYGNGLDCSAFVSWAMYNGGCKNDTTAVTSGVQATYGVETTSDNLKAGDIIANSSHVMLVLSNSGTSVIVAHASGTNIGIVFSEKTYDALSGYQLRDMSSYYQENCSS